MRFSLIGWRLRHKPKSMILHRFPWQKSWVKQLEIHPAAHLVFSRLGRTYLVVESEVRTTKVIKLVGLILSIVFAALALSDRFIPAVDRGSTSTQKISAIQPSNGPMRICPVTQSDYLGRISDWLSMRDIEPVEISQETQVEIGGIRSSTLLISCQTSQMRVRLKEVKQQGAWQIKETAQLTY